MKFYYYIYLNNKTSPGVYKKFLYQVNELIKLDIPVKVILCGEKIAIDIDENFVEYYAAPKSYGFYKVIKLYLIRANILWNLVRSLDSNSILYLRYPYPYIFNIYAILQTKKLCKVITEHNTLEIKEFRNEGYMQFVLEFTLGKVARKYSDAFLGVTNEITEHQLERANNFKKPCITISNGIDVSSIKIRSPPIYLGNTLDLIFVAKIAYWHGLDRLLNGFSGFKGAKIIKLHIVGVGNELENIKKLVVDLKIEDVVLFHGFLSGKPLDDLFDTSHIAVGSLGLHRLGMKEGSILKAREYCARGIPFLYGCSDPDFPDSFPYIHRVSGDESPVDIEEIISFAKEVYSDPEHHIKMRRYAEENLDWSVKMRKLKDFCETLVEK